MSAHTKDGGPAFPAKNYIVPNDLEERYVRALGATQGMSLRDYFAAKVIGHLCVSELRQEKTTQQDASYAYAIADAMLKAREVRHD